jgi:hypothetical protein
MLESKVLATYTNRQGNTVTIRQYGEYSSLHVEVAATRGSTTLRALSAQCKAARAKCEKEHKVHTFGMVSQGGSSSPERESLTNVYA